MSVTIRPLRANETDLVGPLATRAFDDLMRRQDRPPRTPSDEAAASYRVMHAHLRSTDPDGCLLALADDEPVGVALSYVRGELWVLSLLVVDPRHQSTGAGFRLLPAMSAEGVPAVTEAPALVDAPLDGPLAVDLEQVRATGGSVRCLADDPSGGRGRVAVVGPADRTSVHVLDPVDEASGVALLTGALAELDRSVQIGPLAPQEHWALTVALRAGLEVRGCGPVAVAGLTDPLSGVSPPAAIYV